MRRKILTAATTVALAVGLAFGAGTAVAQAVPPSATMWNLTGRTPISSGYMYTYRNSSGGYFVSANYMGTWFVQYVQQ